MLVWSSYTSPPSSSSLSLRPTWLTSALNWSSPSSAAAHTLHQDAWSHSSAAHTHTSVALGLDRKHTALFMAGDVKAVLLYQGRLAGSRTDGPVRDRRASMGFLLEHISLDFGFFNNKHASWTSARFNAFPSRQFCILVSSRQTVSAVSSCSISSSSINSISISSIPWYERRLELRMRF